MASQGKENAQPPREGKGPGRKGERRSNSAGSPYRRSVPAAEAK